MRRLIAAATVAVALVTPVLAAPSPAVARAPNCTYTGPVYTGGKTYYHVTRTRYEGGQFVSVTYTTTREPKNCESGNA